MISNGDCYIFSLDGGVTPVNRYYFYYGFNKALNNIGITNEQIRERGLNIHTWRHFCNTELQRAGLIVQKVQAVTGYKSERMTEHYTHFDPKDFKEAPEKQANLLKPKKLLRESNNIETEKPALKPVKLTEDEKRPQCRKVS